MNLCARTELVVSRVVRVEHLTSGELNEREPMLNREKHPIFDTTNCVQGTYVM